MDVSHIIDMKATLVAYSIMCCFYYDKLSGKKVNEEWLEHGHPVFATRDLRCVKKSRRISPTAGNGLIQWQQNHRQPRTHDQSPVFLPVCNGFGKKR